MNYELRVGRSYTCDCELVNCELKPSSLNTNYHELSVNYVMN